MVEKDCSDCATAHPRRGAAQNACGCAGCFTAHAAVELYAQVPAAAAAAAAVRGRPRVRVRVRAGVRLHETPLRRTPREPAAAGSRARAHEKCARAPTHTWVPARVRTDPQTHARARARAHVSAHACMDACYARARTRAHARTFTYMRKHTHARRKAEVRRRRGRAARPQVPIVATSPRLSSACGRCLCLRDTGSRSDGTKADEEGPSDTGVGEPGA